MKFQVSFAWLPRMAVLQSLCQLRAVAHNLHTIQTNTSRNLHLLLDTAFVRYIFFPFLVSRLGIFLAGWFAQDNFVVNPTYVRFAQRGFYITRYFWLDMWSHWDGNAYLSIVQRGYEFPESLSQDYSNVAFFPLYPYLVRALAWLVPGGLSSEGLIVLLGLMLSNVCFLAAAWMLYRMALDATGDEVGARRSVELLIVFPASFFFSCFYPEGLFLALTTGVFWMALQKKWLAASILGALAAVTRGQGIAIAAPLVWLYMEAHRWRLKDIRPDILWLGLLPVGLLAHLFYGYLVSGDFLAPMHAQAAWGRWTGDWWNNLQLQLNGPGLDPFKLDFVLLILFLILTLMMFRKPSLRAYSIYSLLLLALPVATALFVSISRYLAIIFPVFLYLGHILTEERSYRLVCTVSFALQVVYFVGFVNYYWIA